MRNNSSSKDVCSSCGTRFESAHYSMCPACGGHNFEADSFSGEDVGMNLAFAVIGCDECDHEFTLDGSCVCPSCGAAVDIEDPHVAARLAAYGAGLSRLSERFEVVSRAKFARTGARASVEEFRDWVHKTVYERLLSLADDLTAAMNLGIWDDSSSETTQEAWTNLQGVVHSSIDILNRVKGTAPPPLFLATHRRVAGAVQDFCAATLQFTSALVATTVYDAHEAKRVAQLALDESGAKAGDAFNLVSTVIENMTIGLDLHRAAEQSHRDGSTSRHKMRAIFPEFAEILDTDPPMTRPLFPLTLSAAAMHDPDRRAERVQAATKLIQEADRANANWAGDMSALVQQFMRAWNELLAQHGRFAAELVRLDEDPINPMYNIFDILSKVAEGPFRRIGAILVIARNVADGHSSGLSEEELARAGALGVVHSRLKETAPPLVEGVEKLTRNAEAHYDFSIHGDMIEIRHRHARSGQAQAMRTASLTRDDLIVETLNLFEVSVAMAAAVVAWSWKHPNPEIREIFRQSWLG